MRIELLKESKNFEKSELIDKSILQTKILINPIIRNLQNIDKNFYFII